jgi:hypothetical protein
MLLTTILIGNFTSLGNKMTLEYILIIIDYICVSSLIDDHILTNIFCDTFS